MLQVKFTNICMYTKYTQNSENITLNNINITYSIDQPFHGPRCLVMGLIWRVSLVHAPVLWLYTVIVIHTQRNVHSTTST